MKILNLKSQKTISLSSIRDLFDISEEWELCAWPISYNESVSFVFRNRNDGDVLGGGAEEDYRFKIFTVSDFDFTKSQKRDLSLRGACLVSIFYWENGYAFAVRDEDDIYSVMFYNENEEELSKIELGPNVTRLMIARDGRIVFGYAGTFPESTPCFVILSADGRVIYQCKEATARACKDLTIDCNDNVWASCYPDVLTYEVKPDGFVAKHQYPVASPDGLIPFDINGKIATILSYSNDEVYVPVNYFYVDKTLYEIQFDDLDPCEIEGISAYAGLVIILTKNNKLHFFKLDEIARALEA